MTPTQVTPEQKELLAILKDFSVEAQRSLIQLSTDKRPRVIVLAGPTACGKTELSLELAEKLGGEILSGDSMQVYRGMDIGTAKASKEELARVPHHMVDVRDVRDPMTVVDFYHESKRALLSIVARNRVPIVVGGSGFYLRSLIYGPPQGPPSKPELRATLEQELETVGVDALYERLSRLDPAYAQTITCHDRQKIVRGLEIIALTGKSVSEISWPKTKPVDYDFHCWFLHRPREVLAERVNLRCEQMLQMGFLEELQRLVKEGLLDNSSAAQAIGYRQGLEYLRSAQGADDYTEFVTQFKRSTRRYVKRQLTWFSKESLFRWIDVESNSRDFVIKSIVEDFLAR